MINGTNSTWSNFGEHDFKEEGKWKEYVIVEESDGGQLASTVMAVMKQFNYLPLGPPNCTYIAPSVGGSSMERTIWFQAMMYNGEENN